ncbi:integrase [Acidobacteria bacterium AB60]|nr:integrase [Acidobacteria bacterium AB60]
MIESISISPSFQRRHRSAPLVKEREQFLTHLLQIGWDANRVRATASYLVRIVQIMGLTSLRKVELREIEEAGARWASNSGPERMLKCRPPSPRAFAITARHWLRFHGALILRTPPLGPFEAQLAEFRSALESRGLAATTIRDCVNRVGHFLQWASERHEGLSFISVNDVDDYLASKREAGLRLITIRGLCVALRAFFIVAEERGWCPPGIWRGILKPRFPAYTESAKGPSWSDVRRLIRSVDGRTPVALRDRALFLLFSIYGLRASEVARLRLDDFDWRNETFCVHRAKRGGIQQFPIQYEVGEAILDYLRCGRPRCACRNIFLTVQLPWRPFEARSMWGVIGKRMKRLGIQSERCGPHSLRHSCATQLLKTGSSLKEIADFLGHRTVRSVATYAKYDRRSLRKVAAFSLAAIL